MGREQDAHAEYGRLVARDSQPADRVAVGVVGRAVPALREDPDVAGPGAAAGRSRSRNSARTIWSGPSAAMLTSDASVSGTRPAASKSRGHAAFGSARLVPGSTGSSGAQFEAVPAVVGGRPQHGDQGHAGQAEGAEGEWRGTPGRGQGDGRTVAGAVVTVTEPGPSTAIRRVPSGHRTSTRAPPGVSSMRTSASAPGTA